MQTIQLSHNPLLKMTEITDCLFSFFFKIETSFIKVLTEQEIVIL